MQEHVEIMLIERDELSLKVKALHSFVFNSCKFNELGDLKKRAMVNQLGYMTFYLEVLEFRIFDDS